MWRLCRYSCTGELLPNVYFTRSSFYPLPLPFRFSLPHAKPLLVQLGLTRPGLLALEYVSTLHIYLDIYDPNASRLAQQRMPPFFDPEITVGLPPFQERVQ